MTLVFEGGLSRSDETLEMDPNHGESHYGLGMGHLNQGRMPEAAQELELYLAREPGGRFADRAIALLPQIKKPGASPAPASRRARRGRRRWSSGRWRHGAAARGR